MYHPFAELVQIFILLVLPFRGWLPRSLSRLMVWPQPRRSGAWKARKYKLSTCPTFAAQISRYINTKLRSVVRAIDMQLQTLLLVLLAATGVVAAPKHATKGGATAGGPATKTRTTFIPPRPTACDAQPYIQPLCGAKQARLQCTCIEQVSTPVTRYIDFELTRIVGSSKRQHRFRKMRRRSKL